MDRRALTVAAALALAPSCGGAPTRSGHGVPRAGGDAAPTGLAVDRVLARGVLGYGAAATADAVISVELGERFALVARDRDSGRAEMRVDLGGPERDVLDLAVGGGEAWVTGTDGTARAFALPGGAARARYPLGHLGTAIALSADYVAVGTDAGVLCLRRRTDGALLQCAALFGARVSGLSFDADGDRLAATGWDGRVMLVDVPSLAVRAQVEVGGSANGVSLSPDGAAVAVAASARTPIRTPEIAARERRHGAGDGDPRVIVWRPGAAPRSCRGHHDLVTSVAWVGGGAVISGSWDRTVRLWRSEDCAPIATLGGFDGPIAQVTAGAPGRALVAAWPSNLHSRSTVVVQLLYPN